MPTQLNRPITDTERTRYREDGVVCLRGIYPAPWLETLDRELNDVFARGAARRDTGPDIAQGNTDGGVYADMVELGRMLSQVDPEYTAAVEGDTKTLPTSRSVVETDVSVWHEGMRRHNLEGPLPELVHALTGSERVVFYSDQLFLKEPGSRLKTPFHQDKPYFLVDGGDVAVAWVSPDQVDANNGPMGYVKGSHRWGKTFIPSDFQTERGTFPPFPDMSYEGLVPIDHDGLKDRDFVYFETEPGDVIVHHWGTLHGSRGNVSATRARRAASVRFACDGCTFYKRPSSPEPFRNTLGLVDGAPLESHARFPLAWPREAR